MRDEVKAIGHMIDKQKTVYISSVDENGFPNTRQCFHLGREEVYVPCISR